MITSNTSNGFSGNISFFIHGRTSSDPVNKKNEIYSLNPLQLFYLSSIPFIFIILSDSPISTISPYIYIYMCVCVCVCVCVCLCVCVRER